MINTRIITTLLGLFLCSTSIADWSLDDSVSSMSFTSVKNAAVVEPHHFTRLSGSVSESGLAILTIDLTSIETLIPIRNERMQSMLFSTNTFPSASVQLQLDPETLKSLSSSTGSKLDVSGMLSLRGKDKKVSASLLVTGTHDGGVLVTTTKPVMIYANQWELNQGISALQTIAGLSSIATTVPVNFSLKFMPTQTVSAQN